MVSKIQPGQEAGPLLKNLRGDENSPKLQWLLH